MQTKAKHLLTQGKEYALEHRSRLATLFVLGISQIGIILLGLAGNGLFARVASTEVYGQYQVVLSLMAIVATFCLTGLSESLTISAAKRYDGNLWIILLLNFGVTLLGSVALALAAFFYRNSQPEIVTAVLIAAALFPFYNLSTIWMPWLTGRGKLKENAGLRLIYAALVLVALVALFVFKAISLQNITLGILGLQAIFSFVVIVCLLQRRANAIVHRETVTFGLHATLATVLGGLFFADTLIINHYLSAHDVAVYTVASLFPSQVKAVFNVFNQFLTPRVYKSTSVQSAWEYLKGKMFLITVFFGVMGLAGFLVFPVVIPFFFSQRYVEAIPYAKWLWLNLSITAPTTYLANVLRSQRKIQFVYTYEIGSPVFALILFSVFISFGLQGMVIARIIVYWVSTAYFIFSFWYYARREARCCMGKSITHTP